MLKDVVARIKQEIDSEKRKRVTTEEGIILLMEETISKINAASLC